MNNPLSSDRRRPTPGQLTKEARAEIPLRAKSVCLAERPLAKYVRAVRSADPIRPRQADKRYVHRQPSAVDIKRRHNNVYVKQQNRKVAEKIPCSISVQTLSIPMKYADSPKPRHSTSKPPDNLYNCKRVDINKTKSRNPHKQVGENKRLCQTISCGKETENKLLVQIREAEQVSDFERILNTNAIQCERAAGHVWRGCAAAYKPSASVVPRPRSAYSLYAVSQAYHYLFRQHEESLQPLIDEYRKTNTGEHDTRSPTSILGGNGWYENLQDLSEFYEDDQTLRKEVESITDRIITEEIKTAEISKVSGKRNKNFKVNLAGLIELHVNGEGCSPRRDDLRISPDIEKEADNEKEWLAPIMSANSDDQENSQGDSNVDCLAQNLNSVKIDSDANVPTITFSDCCDGGNRNELPHNTNVVIHLAVPSIDIVNEERRPTM